MRRWNLNDEFLQYFFRHLWSFMCFVTPLPKHMPQLSTCETKWINECTHKCYKSKICVALNQDFVFHVYYNCLKRWNKPPVTAICTIPKCLLARIHKWPSPELKISLENRRRLLLTELPKFRAPFRQKIGR